MAALVHAEVEALFAHLAGLSRKANVLGSLYVAAAGEHA